MTVTCLSQINDVFSSIVKLYLDSGGKLSDIKIDDNHKGYASYMKIKDVAYSWNPRRGIQTGRCVGA